ncbi:MAG: LacI family DNA-binding transcriptional regulator [Bacillota bacterium]
MTTLKEIAEHVGVSISTVSRVINNDLSRNIHPETKRKVWDAVKDYGYKPNQNARNLASQKKTDKKKTMQIGCLVQHPHLIERYDPYYSPIFNGISKTLTDHKYSLIYIDSFDKKIEETDIYRSINSDTLDGIILFGNFEENVLSFIKNQISCIVALETAHTDCLDVSLVDYDRQSASRAAIKHLIEQGHEKIGFIGGGTGADYENLSEEERYKGYVKALHEFGLEFEANWIVNARWTPSLSYSSMKEILNLESKPTAMFCASDTMAIAAMRSVYENKLQIPEDVAFIGIDNIEMSLYSNPPLSTIHIPKYEIGKAAVNVLLNQIEERMDLPVVTLLPYQLIARESSTNKSKLKQI